MPDQGKGLASSEIQNYQKSEVVINDEEESNLVNKDAKSFLIE